MAETPRLLILGGTTEAAALAERATATQPIHVITSFAGRTRAPVAPAGEMRIGGFGGSEGLAQYLRRERIGLVVDATHPFAATISRNAASACAAAGVPRLMLVRPAWERQAGDHWIDAEDVPAAASALSAVGGRAFLTVGRNEVRHFAAADGAWFLVRVIDPPPDPLPLKNYEVIRGRGPFTVSDERALFASHRIDVLVSKNSGGTATYAKIEAARDRGLPVIMVRRPTLPDGDRAESAEGALAWIERRVT